MPGIGTIINVAGIVAGGTCGLVFGKMLNEKIRYSLITCNGVVVLFIAIGGAVVQMITVEKGTLSMHGTVMTIICMALGTLSGSIIDIEKRLENFGEWLKKKSGNSKDTQFVDAFVTASLTVCIGAMAIVGSIQDVINLDHTILISKTILDMIYIMVMTAGMGKGCIFSAVCVGIFQGFISVAALFAGSFLTEKALRNISLVGYVMIFCVGLNLIREKKISVANMLPSIIFAAIWAFTPLPV